MAWILYELQQKCIAQKTNYERPEDEGWALLG